MRKILALALLSACLATPAAAQLSPSGNQLLQRQQDQTNRMLQDQLQQRRQQIRDRQLDEQRRRTEELIRRQSQPSVNNDPYTVPPGTR